ncbi:hypothetical protein [Paenibacillus filicis]
MEQQLRQLKSECDRASAFIGISIYAPEELEREQIGYRVDTEGVPLVSDEEGAWQQGWIVIGSVQLTGDPIIVDTGEAGQPVSYLMHGMGEWEAGSYIAGSIGQCIEAIAKVRLRMTSQEPDRMNVPVASADLDAVVADITAADEYAQEDVWKGLLAPSYRVVRQQEEAVIRTIKSMSGQGMKVKEIADDLQIPLKQAYSYLKQSRIEVD